MRRPWLAALAALAVAIAAPRSLPAQESLGPMDYGWRVTTPAGETLAVARFRGEVLFLNVWATWCRPCVTEMPSIQALQRRYAQRGVRFVAVAADRPGAVERFLRRHQLSLPVYLEADPIPASLGVAAVPTTLIVDRHGRIVLRHRGGADWDRPEVHAFLEALLATGPAADPGRLP